MEEAQRLANKLGLGFAVVSDPELSLIRRFGVEMQGREIAIPSMFVLEAKTGRITWRYIGETMFDRPQLQPVLEAIDRASGTPNGTPNSTPNGIPSSGSSAPASP